MIKPIFKYTGGKYDEFKSFQKFIPDSITNYYEPFVGGGGVMFQLHNNGMVKGNSYINDKSTDLINLYKNITSKEFISDVKFLSNVWCNVTNLADFVSEQYCHDFVKMLIENNLSIFIDKQKIDCIIDFFKNDDIISSYETHGYDFFTKISHGLQDKSKRFLNKGLSSNEINIELAKAQISTSICQSFYFTIRDMYNDWLLNPKSDYTISERCSQWLFIREFCYGAMFRYSKDGKFNIPYGGHSYNSKCFKCKVDDISNDEMQDFFQNRVYSESKDFEDFLDKDFNKDDFIFLDPPYICTFSDYDNNAFTLEDHTRLRDVLKRLNNTCNWMMVIRPCEEIDKLYAEDCFYKRYFDKTYAYQPRKGASYDAKTCQHVIITNYKLAEDSVDIVENQEI